MTLRTALLGLLVFAVASAKGPIGTADGASVQDTLLAAVGELPFAMPAIRQTSFPDRVVSIIEQGAVGDGQTMNTAAFERAIRVCAEAGGGTVRVPSGVWLTGPIRLRSNIDFHLDRGALILFSRNRDDYPLVPYPTSKSKNFTCAPPIFGEGLDNIAITGHGIIDGAGDVWRPVKREKLTAREWKDLVSSGGANDGSVWWPSRQAMDGAATLRELRTKEKTLSASDFAAVRDYLRPHMIDLYGCTRVLLDGPTFRNSPKYCVRPSFCEDLVIRNITVMNDWNAQNGDGIDLTTSRNAIVFNCTVSVGDDAICIKPGSLPKNAGRTVACENIVITGCTVYRGHGGFVIGSETNGGARNIAVRNCTFVGTDVGLRFKSDRSRGGLIEDVFISGIRMSGIANEAILFDLFYENVPAGERARGPSGDRLPQFRRFSITDIVCNGADRAVRIVGLPEMPVRDIRIGNETFDAVDGVSCSNAEGLRFDSVRVLNRRGPVFSVDNAAAVTIARPQFRPDAEVFLRVAGERSKDIRVEQADLSMVKRSVDRSPEVSPGAVTVQ